MRSIKLVSLLLFLFVLVLVPWNLGKAQQGNLLPEVIAYADTVLYNGKVLTADEKFTIAEAVAIRNGKFLAVGTSERITAMAGPQTRRIDLKGKGVIPGIIDLHQHPFTEGQLAYWAEKWMPDEPEWRNAEEAVAGIKRAVARAKPGEVVILPRIYIGPASGEEGGREKEAICDALPPAEKYRSNLPCAPRAIGANFCRLVSRAQMDSVSPNNPVLVVSLVNLGVHAANTKAYEAIKAYVPGGVVPPAEGGRSCVGGGGGQAAPSTQSPGELMKNYLMFWNEPLEEWMKAFRMASQGISAVGITLTKEHTAVQLLAGIRELWARGELTVRMRMPYPLTPLTSPSNSIEVPPENAELLFRRMGNMSGIGDDMLRFSGIRIEAVGGAILGGNPWTLEPKIRDFTTRTGDVARPCGGPCYGDTLEPGQEVFRGRESIVQAVRFGWDVSSDHTIGDRAVRELLNAMEEGLQKQIVKRPNQLLHLGHTPIAAVEDIERMKKLGVIATIGVWHIWLPSMIDAGVMQFGTERFDKMAAPMKSYTKIGLRPGLEGDVPGAIFWRMEKAITRKDDKYMREWNRTEAVTRQEALWMSTLWGAEVIGEKHKLGSIEVGKLADLVVVDKDFMTIPADDISEIQTLLTMVGGKAVFEQPGSLQ